MIIVRLIGGLGNQMFQYALGRQLATLHHQELKLDVSAYQGNVADPMAGVRVFGLSHFKIKADVANEDDLKIFHHYHRTDKIGKIYKLINLLKLGRYWQKKYIVEPNHHEKIFDQNLLKGPIKNPVYVKGYWQTEKYFKAIEKEIREELIVKTKPDEYNTMILKKMKETNSVSLHIRHGDNANQVAACHGVLPMDFYHQATEQIASQVDDPHFFVFSDDLKWAKENLKLNYPTTFIDGNNDEKNYEDLRLMSACQHHIVGNSSFSWWGAWLGQNPNKIILAPKDYHIGHDVSVTDYYPSTWHLL